MICYFLVSYTHCALSRYGAGIADDLGSVIPSASAHASAFIVDVVPIVTMGTRIASSNLDSH